MCHLKNIGKPSLREVNLSTCNETSIKKVGKIQRSYSFSINIY